MLVLALCRVELVSRRNCEPAIQVCSLSLTDWLVCQWRDVSRRHCVVVHMYQRSSFMNRI